MFANLPILEGLHLSHLSCSIHTHVIQEFFDDLNSVSVFDPVVVDGSLTERGHIPVRHAQEYKKLGLPKSLSPFQIQRSTMNNNGILSYSLGCLAGGNAFLPQRPEMSRNFIFPGFVNRHGENHGKKEQGPRVYRENPWFRNILSNMVGFPHRQRSTRTRRAEGAGGAGSVAAAASRGSGQSGRLAETVTSLQGIAPSDEHLGL